MEMAVILDLEVKMFQNILLSSKVIVLFCQNCDGGYLGFSGLDGLKLKK